MVVRAATGARYLRYTEATRDAESWSGNYGTATSNAYLGVASQWEMSINGGTWSGPSYVYGPNYVGLPTTGPDTVDVRFTYDSGTTFVSPVSASVNVQP